MAKRKSRGRKRPGSGKRRSGGPATGVGRSVKLDDLLVAPTAGSSAAAATAAAPAPAPAVDPAPAKPRLEVVTAPELDGPIVRLAVVWAIVTFVAAAVGVIAIALCYALMAAVAALQASQSWRKRPREPVRQLAAAGAALLPLAAAVSLPVLGGALVAVGAACLAYRPDPRRSAPVVVRRFGLVEVVVLLSLVGVYDASAFLVGTGATRWWEGPAAGIAFMFAVTLAAAAVFVPPFGGVSAWLLGALAAGLAPLGPLAARSLVGDKKARVPALARLDSLLVLGPLWAAAAYFLL